MRDFPFSNFQPAPMRFRGISYPTVEHFYQAMKSRDPADHKRIAALPSAAKAKRAGRKLPIRHDWPQIRDQVMLVALRAKFRQPEHRAALLAFEGPIVEFCLWHDVYWGQCMCERHQGEGENRLGKMLEQIREEIRQEEACRSPKPPAVSPRTSTTKTVSLPSPSITGPTASSSQVS